MEIFVATVWGLIIGSFLNVVIHRLPRAIMKDQDSSIHYLLWPASTAPCCGEKLSWKENIPVFSWIFLRGKCAHCGDSITPRYVAVELLTAATFAWSAFYFGLTGVAVLYAIFFAIAICLFFIDLETFLLPDTLTYSMLWMGLLGSALGYLPVSSQDAIYGSALGYLLPWSVNKLYFFFRKQDGFGGGDFKLLAALGAWTGWVHIVPILCGASIVGLIVIAFSTLLKRQRLTMNQAFPFGPFLLISGLGFVVGRL